MRSKNLCDRSRRPEFSTLETRQLLAFVPLDDGLPEPTSDALRLVTPVNYGVIESRVLGGSLYHASSSDSAGTTITRTDLSTGNRSRAWIANPNYVPGATSVGSGVSWATGTASMELLGKRLLVATSDTLNGMVSIDFDHKRGPRTVPLGITAFARGATVGTAHFFGGKTNRKGYELFRTDGTPEGTVTIADLAKGSRSSYPTSFQASTGGAYFTHSSGRLAFVRGADNAVWTSATVGNVISIVPLANGRAIVLTGGGDVYSTDGTDAGTWLHLTGASNIAANDGRSVYVALGSDLITTRGSAASRRTLASSVGSWVDARVFGDELIVYRKNPNPETGTMAGTIVKVGGTSGYTPIDLSFVTAIDRSTGAVRWKATGSVSDVRVGATQMLVARGWNAGTLWESRSSGQTSLESTGIPFAYSRFGVIAPDVAVSDRFILADSSRLGGVMLRGFDDANGNGRRDSGERAGGLFAAGIDLNGNGKIDFNEPSSVSRSNSATGTLLASRVLAPGTYTVLIQTQEGFTARRTSYAVDTIAGEIASRPVALRPA